ncbi:hypothetical protein YC2023_071367 [Brassica napus]
MEEDFVRRLPGSPYDFHEVQKTFRKSRRLPGSPKTEMEVVWKTSWKSSGKLPGSRLVSRPRSLPDMKSLHIKSRSEKPAYPKTFKWLKRRENDLLRVFTGSGTFWRNMVILELFKVQNCTDASDQKVCMFYWRVVSLPRERKLLRRGTYVDRCRTLDIDRYGCQNADRAYFMTNLGSEVTTYYQYTPGRPETLNKGSRALRHIFDNFYPTDRVSKKTNPRT